MYLVEDILEKINNSKQKLNNYENHDEKQKITLSDIMIRTFGQVKELAGETLSWGEMNFLYQHAQKELAENKLTESRILSRANPQLANAVRLGIRQSSMQRSYDDLFPQRADSFVKPGSVASMFSPAGYLTELYREAKGLHTDTSEYHLDTRRPDLATLSLSQNNMDEELSTLSLSNELLLNNIQSHEGKSYDEVMEMLSTYRYTGTAPFHLPYEMIRKSINLKDPEFVAFQNNPSVASKVDTASLLSIQAGISPELYQVLTEDIEAAAAKDAENDSDTHIKQLIQNNFGDIEPILFQSKSWLASYYELSNEELESLLGVILTSDTPLEGLQYFQNDQAVAFLSANDGIESILMTRIPGGNYDQFGYVELIPLSRNSYKFEFTVKSGFAGPDNEVDIGTQGVLSSNILKDGRISGLNTPLSVDIEMSEEELRNGVNFSVTRYNKSKTSWQSAGVTFHQYGYPFDVFLLKLNKIILLYKATDISITNIRSVVESSNNSLAITPDVLRKLFWVHFYMRQYGIDVNAALVLSGALISQNAHNTESSAFTLLFNSPPLNNTEFAADSEGITLDPASASDTFRTGVMKRAFKVSDTELYTLWKLATGKYSPPDFTANIANLSVMRRISLLAEVHSLSVAELAALLSVSTYANQAIESLTVSEFSILTNFVEQFTRWLREMKWTVGDLYLMATDNFSTGMTPEIENLMSTLKNGLANHDLALATEDEIISAAAPLIAAAVQLDSAESADAILHWLNQIKPQELSVRTFLTLAEKESLTEHETVNLVSFSQVLGQMSYFVRSSGLTSSVLAWVVEHPSVMKNDLTQLPHDITTLRDFTLLHALIARCGTKASEILTSLSGDDSSVKSNLSVKTVATALALDEAALTQALAQVSAYPYFYNWPGLRDALEWMDVAGIFGITPAGVATLAGLTQSSSEYVEWTVGSHILQAGLNAAQTAQLNASLDEEISTALSTFAIKNIAPTWVINRDKLYSWLLMDTQVSAQVKTTRIAEAIASVQLYVNRALSGQEDGVVNAVKSGQFFSKDWENYNKRYSTWAGVSELVYYPENYVDATMRIGQTSMMDEMLQSLSQSQLNSDTVEDAFKTYMTRFEEIANLDVISGYHDSVSDQNGTTYILGRSSIGDYYWRNADIGKMSDGKLPANAWSEWKKITAALTPVNNLVRPVIFQSRLYLVWVESKETATASDSTTAPAVQYLLKYAHILHDGTWSAPVTAMTEQSILPLEGVHIDDIGMYCARDAEQEKLYIYFYKKESSYTTFPEKIAGISLTHDGVTEKILSNTVADSSAYFYIQLDTTTIVRLNTPYTKGSSECSVSDISRTDNNLGYGNYTQVLGGSISNIVTDVADESVEIQFRADANVAYRSAIPAVSMMKDIGVLGLVFYVPQTFKRSEVAARSNRNFQPIFRFRQESWYDVYVRVTDSIPSVNNDKLHGYNDSSPNNLNATTTIYNTNSFKKDATDSKLWIDKITNFKPQNYVYIFMTPYGANTPVPNELMFSDFVRIDTALTINNVNLTISLEDGSVIGSFTSDKRSKYTFDDSVFVFSSEKVKLPLGAFKQNTAAVTFKLSAQAPAGDGRALGSETFTVTLVRSTKTSLPTISLNKSVGGAQFLQYGVHRIRVNTLFAKQLVARANAGLNTVLSMETQQLHEPQLGRGFYVDFVLPAHNESIHGNSRNFTLNLKHVVDNEAHVIYSGQLINVQQSVRLFVPLDEAVLHDNVIAKVFLKTANINDGSWSGAHFKYTDSTQTAIEINSSSDISMFDDVIILNNQTTEPMDFSGANALYFWEMFYYVPMMVFKRLLSEGKFAEASQWIKYVWSPDGYLLNGQPATYQWNVRPLEEETTWNANPLDSVDPDSVAQADPMHYKVATFMGYLDLLIARGDAAYRQLERDTLSEAKMWYVQALDILGDEPYFAQSATWAWPRLSDAASATAQTQAQQALRAVRQKIAATEPRTANSLTSLFLPQQNAKLAGYWQTLAQRLYNLRNNLSIDGNPLSLSIYAAPADPTALLSAAVNASSGGGDLTTAYMPLYRFPMMLESARGMVGQLTQFGSLLLSITERQDGEALSELLQTQGSELVLQSIALQNNTISEIDADKTALEASRSGAQARMDSYAQLYDEDVNTGEAQAMNLALASSVLSTTALIPHAVAAGLDSVPNIYGLAVGGSRYGAISRAIGIGIETSASAVRVAADNLSQSEMYRRRRQEWEIQRNNAESEVNQIDAQLNTLALRREGAVLQKTYLETQQSQTQAQLAFLQNKFTSKALYNWLRGKLASIYYQFYDLTVSRCLMAQEAYKWALGAESASFIRPGAWQGTYAGLMAGETLMLNLAQLEQSYLQKDAREKEVTRTVCLSEVYAGHTENDAFSLADKLTELVNTGQGIAGTDSNGLKLQDGQLQATLKLSGLNIGDDYPSSLGETRRIKQISVSLPALVGPYQDVRAVLSYGGSVVMPQGCSSAAISHGMSDSGQFQLDFNDSRWLPFEGIPVSDSGTLVLSFPDADSRQKELLLTLSDIILHIRYTIF